MAANFDELLSKVSTWDVEEEEILINKIKHMTEDYQQKCSDLSINLNNMNRNLHLIEVDFYNTLNGLKTISGKKFIEHVIDTEDIKPEDIEKEDKKEKIDEDLMNDNYNSVNSIVQRGLDFIAFRDQQKSQNKNNVEDDTVSMNSKVMDNNLMKNNRGLKLPMLIGTKDFKENEYIGLVLDDEEEEENFDNEIRNEQGVTIPKEGVTQGEENINNNIGNVNNNPEEFHNMVQQQMGKPIKSQNMFENNDIENKGESEFINPAMESMRVEEDANIGGLGGLLRKSAIQPNIQNLNNNMINNNINNMTRTNTNLNNLRKTAIGGKISLSNFLSKDIFGDDDDDDNDSSGLFGRPQKLNRGLGMTMVPSNNMKFDNNINNNIQTFQGQNILNNNMMSSELNQQYQNNNAVNEEYQNNMKNNIQYPNNINNNIQLNQNNVLQEQNEKPLNQRMEIVPSPLLLSLKQNNNINPQNNINNILENIDDEDNNNDLGNFQNKRKNLEKLFNQGQNQNIMKPPLNDENMNENQVVKEELNNNETNNNINQIKNNQDNNIVNNNQNIMHVSQRELENRRKLENAKSKINSIFGDDDDEEDDIFSKKINLNKAEKIEEKSQNLQERLNQLTSSYQTETSNITNRMDQLFNNNNNDSFINKNINNFNQNNINNDKLNNNNQINNQFISVNKNDAIKKTKFFFDEEDDDDLNIKFKNKNINQINQNINQKIEINVNQNNQNIKNNYSNINKNEQIKIEQQTINNNLYASQNKNEPKIIMPKQIIQQQPNIVQEPKQVKIEHKKVSMFLFEGNDIPKNNNNNSNLNKNISNIKTENNNNNNLFNNEILGNNNNINNNIFNNKEVKAPISLFDGIDNQKPEKKEETEKKKTPNFLFEEEEKKKKKKRKNFQLS